MLVEVSIRGLVSRDMVRVYVLVRCLYRNDAEANGGMRIMISKTLEVHPHAFTVF